MSGFAGIWQIGPREVAVVLGLPLSQYRATSTATPIAAGNLLTSSLLVWITADAKLMAAKAFDRKKPDEVFAGLDVSQTRVGDYLVGQVVAGGEAQTFFIVSQDVPAPIRLALCNRVLSIYKPGEQTPGPTFYSGDIGGLGASVLTGWPASVIQGTKGEAGVAKLPGDVRAPWFSVLLPAFPGVQINVFDVATDDDGQRYIISSVEETTFGYRLTLSYAGT